MKNKKSEKLGKRLIRYTDDGWTYLKESRKYVYFATALFFVSAFIGFFFSSYFGFYDEILKWMIGNTSNLNGVNLGIFIFFNNFKSAFFSLFLGMLLVGAFSVFNSALNGSLLGYVLHKLWESSGANHFWKILPHGVFELPALFICWGLGVKIGMFIFSKTPLRDIRYYFESSLKTFFFIVVPLLLVAAIIESVLISVMG